MREFEYTALIEVSLVILIVSSCVVASCGAILLARELAGRSSNMGKILKDCFWHVIVVWVFGFLGSATMIWGLVLMFSPSIAGELPSSFYVDARVWFVVTIIILVFMLFRILQVAYGYRLQVEKTTRHTECRGSARE